MPSMNGNIRNESYFELQIKIEKWNDPDLTVENCIQSLQRF